MARKFQSATQPPSGLSRQLRLHKTPTTPRARILLALWLLATFLALAVVLAFDLNRAASRLDTLSKRYLQHVSDRALVSETAIEGFAAFIGSMQHLDHAKARVYAEQLLDRYPYLYMFEIAERVPDEARAELEAALDREHPGFQVKRFSYHADRKWRRAEPASFYYPLVFQAPLFDDDNLLGLDIHGSDFLRTAMQTSFERGHPVATQPFELAEGGQGYVLHRSVEHVGERPPDAFAANRYTLLAIMSERLFSEIQTAPARVELRLTHRDFDADQGTVLAKAAVSSAAERRLLPRLSRTQSLGIDSQPFDLDVHWQVGWADLSLGIMLAIVAGSLLALTGVRSYARHYIEEELTGLEDGGTLYNLANFDTLTGLANRNRLTDFLETAIAHAQRQNHKCFVLFIDLDGFKQINDTLGHVAGDEVLARIANRLAGELRHDELLARYGGDEFIWVTAGMDDIGALDPLVARLQSAFATPLGIGKANVSLSASIGWAVYPDDARNIAGLFEVADEVMYREKRLKQDRSAVIPAISTPDGHRPR